MNSLKVVQNDDGFYTLEWNKEDPNWKFLNHLTSNEIQIMIREAIQEDQKRQ